jgi:hypothetical protein
MPPGQASRASGGESPRSASTFARLRFWDWIALVAALALLFTLALDWYGTPAGDEARRVERLSRGAADGTAGEIERTVNPAASEAAEEAEKNAWQADGALDRILLALALAAAVLAILAAFMRAAGRRFEPPLTPSAAAGVLAAAAAALIGYRMLQEPGPDYAVEVRAGAPLALIALALIALAASRSLRAEEGGRQFRTPSWERRPRRPFDREAPEG